MSNNVKTTIDNMLFAEKIKELRVKNQMPQRRLAAALDIDTATYCKIEKGERKAKKEQISILSNMFHEDTEALLVLWLADKVTEVVSEDRNLAERVLSVAAKNLKNSD